MKSYKSVDDYIAGHPEYSEELTHLRVLLNSTELEETVKWGAPCYTIKGKNVIGLTAFKSYVGLWFHQGVFLQDKSKKLINAQEGVTKALRQWRFVENKEIDDPLILEYVQEAIQNQKEGKMMKPEKKPLIIPDELQAAFDEDYVLKDQYETFSHSCKREFAEYISDAKREATRLSRLEKVRSMIMAGKGLNDQYR